MADAKAQNGGNGTDSSERQFTLNMLYVKDLSFEVPHAPEIYRQDQAETQVNMNLKNSHQKLDDDTYEIVLHVALHATVDERTLFMLEIDQAGQFVISGCSDDEVRQLVSATCPGTLFPYAREAISATIGRGGFPAILLQPINFDALFAQSEAERTRQDA